MSERGHQGDHGQGGSQSGGAARPPLKPAYLIIGDDIPKVELALRRLKARITGQSATDPATDLNIDEFNATVDSAAQVINAANTLAFLGGTRLVLVHEVQAWVKAEKEKVAAYLRSPAPDACLALVAEKLSATDLLRTAMEKHGEVLEYRAPKEAQLPAWLAKQAAARRLHLGLAEARLLVQRIGNNQAMLLRELEKLQAYVGDRPVEADDIRRLTNPGLETSIFSLLDSLALGRGTDAFAALEELMASGERIEVLFYRIARHFQNLSRVAALEEQGFSPEAMQTELKMKAYPVRKLREQAARLGPDGIARSLAILAATDARMKGMGTLPEEMELQLCVGKLLGN